MVDEEKKSMHYPVMLNLQGKKVVVIGGGKVATRKVKGMIECGAKIIIISPDVTDEIRRLVDFKKVTWKKKRFEREDIDDAFMIIAATNDSLLHERILQETKRHQLVNVVDNPTKGNVIIPASFHRGKLTVSISTNGAYPGLSKKLKDELSEHFDDRYEEYLAFLERCRNEVLQTILDRKERQEILTKLLNANLLEKESGKWQETFEKLMKKR